MMPGRHVDASATAGRAAKAWAEVYWETCEISKGTGFCDWWG
jgi:hypothetical protein